MLHTGSITHVGLEKNQKDNVKKKYGKLNEEEKNISMLLREFKLFFMNFYLFNIIINKKNNNN